MEQKMQPRNNSRNLPTLDLRKDVTIRLVEEAYQVSDDNDKTSNKQILVFYAIWIVCIAGIMVWAVMTYPPSMVLLIIELLTGVVVTGGLFIFKSRKL